MKITELSEQDIRNLHALKTIIDGGEFKANGKDLLKSGRALDWFEQLIKACAQEFATSVAQRVPVSQPAVEEPKASTAVQVEPEPAPAGGLPKGARIKAFHPGKVGK